MKKALISCVLVCVSMLLTANDENNSYKNSVEEEFVPTDVVERFKKDHEHVQENKWYPYPYRFSFKSNKNSRVDFTAVNLLSTPDFYEAEYEHEEQVIRKIYDLEGECIQQVTVLQSNDIPEELLVEIQELGYQDWEILSYEEVKDFSLDEVQFFHKFLLSKSPHTTAIYFQDNYSLSKERAWEVSQVKTSENETFLVKTAYQGERNKVEVHNLTWNVRVKINQNIPKSKILSYWESEPVHVPEKREVLEYYDLKMSNIYGVVYKKKKKILKNIYDMNGSLLETVEIVLWDNLPDYVKNVASNERFKNWDFEIDAEKVNLEGDNYFYRLHAKTKGKSQVFVISKK